MPIERVKKLATQYTVAMVFVMGMVSTFSIMMKPTRFTGSDIQASRGIASLAEPNAFENETEVIQFDCNRTSFDVEHISQVRIRGKACSSKKGARSVASSNIRNEATGLAATVFLTNESSQFTTDFIQLKSGENKITIQNTLDDGSTDRAELSINVKD